MLAVTVGIVVQTSQDSWTSPNAMFIMIITCIFVTAGVLHPEELMCLVPGVLYFLCIPSGFLLLFIYSMINMNVVSWGTREIARPSESLDSVKEREQAKTIGVRDEFKRLALTVCCCIKNRVVNYIEQKAQPQPPQAKKNDIVREVIAELGAMEGRTATDPAATTSAAAAAERTVQAQLHRQDSTTERASYVPASCYESKYGGSQAPDYTRRPPMNSNLLEGRQRIIAKQLDSIQPVEHSRLASASFLSDKFKDNESLSYSQPGRENNPYYSSIQNESRIQRDDLVNPAWITDRSLGRGPIRYLESSEALFWQKLIDKYLKPIDHDRDHEAKITADLRALRNNACFLFFMLNFLWLFIIVLLQIVQDQLKETLYIRIPTRGGAVEERHFEPLSVAFLFFFAMILMIQFISMLFHRYGTFLHILASTSLTCCINTYHPVAVADIVETVKVLQQIKGIEEDEEEDGDTDYDMLGGSSPRSGNHENPDIVSCGGDSVHPRRSTTRYSTKTLRGAFVKRYNALSKRSQRQKPRRPAVQQVFDNASFQDQV